MQNKKRNVHEHINNYKNYTIIDEERKNEKVYLYLCYLQEAKNWVCSVINRDINNIEEFENELQKGNILTDLALRYAPSSVGKVFVDDQLQYRHTDNINFFIDSLREIKLPKVFYFGVLDCYEKKNIPNVIFCIHALAHYLVKIGKPLNIENLYGQKIFSKDEYESKEKELKNIKIPQFSEIQSVISKETLGNLLAPIIKKRVYVAVQKRKKERMKLILEKEIERLENEKQEEEERERREKEQKILKKEREQKMLEKEQETPESIMDKSKDSDTQALADDMSEKVKRKLLALHKKRIQSSLKTYIFKKAFDGLIQGSPSLFGIRKFLFILNQNIDTLKIENEIEKYHQKIKSKLKENYLIESYIDHLEISIGLLMNNKITISNMTKSKPSIDDVLSIYPLETEEYKFFQDFFYTLQTKPKYISKLLISISRKQAEDFIYNYVIPLFSHSKTQRDEYMIHKLVEDLFKRELKLNDHDSVEKNIKNINNENIKKTNNENNNDDKNSFNLESLLATLLVTTHLRVNHNKFSDSFLPIINLLKDKDIDCDPLSISRSLNIQVSNRIDSLAKEEIKDVYMKRLFEFKKICDKLIGVIEDLIETLPYSIRFYIKLLHSHDNYKTKTALFFFNECMVPFILAPDIFMSKKVENFKNKELRSKCYSLTSFVSSFLSENNEGKIINNKLNKDLNNSKINNDVVKTSTPDFYFPLTNFINESKIRFSKIIDRIIDIDEYFTQSNTFRIHKPLVQFTGKESNSILYLFKKNIDQITDESDNFYSQVVNSNPLKYKNNHPITFFLNCDIEDEKHIYGGIKKSIIQILNESDDCYKDLYDLIHNCKNMKMIKLAKDLIKQFDDLEKKGIVSESKRYSEFLKILGNDILKISTIRVQRMKELQMNRITFENTLKREEYLLKKRSNLEDHFNSFTQEIILKNNNEEDQNSKYGSFKYDLNDLLTKGVIKRINDFSDEKLEFVLSCDEPNIFKLQVNVSGVTLTSADLRLDELLRMKYKEIESFSINNLIEIYVDKMVELINEYYFKE
ncbi:Ras GTPase-activating-like protein IQGAP3 [Dictyocoela muelleri]|nr:Ras GTPase-activating-like protein IQGAP3 [Dictyocoela muelleri]